MEEMRRKEKKGDYHPHWRYNLSALGHLLDLLKNCSVYIRCKYDIVVRDIKYAKNFD